MPSKLHATHHVPRFSRPPHLVHLYSPSRSAPLTTTTQCVCVCPSCRKHCSGVCGHDGEPRTSAVPRPAVGDEQAPRSPPLSSSAPVHGSLFDGLQVYVVGGRQPLGSQHASGAEAAAAAAAAGRLSARSAQATTTTPTTARTMVLDSHRLSMSSRQHQRQQWETLHEQPQTGYPSSQHTSLVSASTASFSSGALEPNWRDHVLSAPSTVAPSPPMPLHSNSGMSESGSSALLSAVGATGAAAAAAVGGGDANHAAIPGSARALARMMHFSGDSNHPAASSSDGVDSPGRASTKRGEDGSSLSAPTSSGGNVSIEMAEGAVGPASLPGGGGSGDDDGTPRTEAIGSWMTSGDHGQDKPVSNLAASIPDLGQCGDEDEYEQTPTPHSSASAGATYSSGADSPATSGGWVSDSGTARPDGFAEERKVIGGQSFVVQPFDQRSERPESGAALAPLPGLWRVFESQGYPYYLHEASGHSQWEDPREKGAIRFQKLLSTTPATNVAAGVRDRVSDLCLEGNEGTTRTEKGVEMASEDAVETPMGTERGHPPPVSPIKPTAVAVAVAVSRYVDTAAAGTRSAENSADCGGEAASKSSKGREQESGNGAFFETTLEENPGRASPSVEGCGSADSRDFCSVDEEESPAMKDGGDSKSESSSDDSDDDCHPVVGINTAGMTPPKSTDIVISGGGWSSGGDSKDPDDGARGMPRSEGVTCDDASTIPADRPAGSVASSTCETRDGYDDEQQEQQEEEDWWQELDDEESGDTKL